MRVARLFSGLICAISSSFALAANGTIRLTTFPTMTVADARSVVTVTAEVRDLNGKPVPDGTQVVFDATTGNFRDSVQATVGGVARAVYIAGPLAGTTKITASALAYTATSSVDLELVSDRSLLSSANEYIVVVAPQYLMYSMNKQIMAAAGANRGVRLRYRDIEIEADDIQLNVSTYELRARKARLKMNGLEADFGELFLVLNRRKGYGTTVRNVPETILVPFGTMFRLLETGLERERLGTYRIEWTKLTPQYEGLPYDTFVFADLTESVSTVAAKRATVFPNKEIQFQKVELYVGDARVLKLPLFQVNLMGGTPLLTDQIFNVDNNQLSINYPHYLSLRPGFTSLLRFRTGQRYGSRSYDVSRGAYVDWELNWNKGDNVQGGLTVGGLGRSDWGINARQYLKLDDRTTMYAQADVTALRNLYASGGLSRQMNGYQVSLAGSSSRTLRGLPYTSEQYSLVAEKDPTKIAGLPVKLFYGLVATHSATDAQGIATSQTAYGLRARAQLTPMVLDRNGFLNASLSLSQLQGHNVQGGLTIQGSANMSYRLSKSASALMSYDYYDDAYSRTFLGKHRVSAQGSYYSGKTSLNIFGSKSLDADRSTLFLDATYKFSNIWRLSYSYTFDRFLQSRFNDYTVGLIYTFGWRDFGLTYNARSNRFGIQVLGASFN